MTYEIDIRMLNLTYPRHVLSRYDVDVNPMLYNFLWNNMVIVSEMWATHHVTMEELRHG